MPLPTQTTRLEAIRPLSPRVREFHLAPPPEPIHFLPGQWISLQLPVGEKPPLVRAYSLAEPEDPSGRLVLALDLVPGGLGSGYLFSLAPGAEITFSGPLGNFVLPDPLDREILFVARYTGIVPVRCILRDLSARPLPVPITLVYGGPEREELIYHDEFLAYAAREPRFGYLPILREPDPTWDGPVGEEIDLVRAGVAGRPRDYRPMIVGVRTFTQPLRAFFREEIGFDRREVVVEHYD